MGVFVIGPKLHFYTGFHLFIFKQKKPLKQPIVKNDEEVEKLKEAPTAAAATVADVKRSGRSFPNDSCAYKNGSPSISSILMQSSSSALIVSSHFLGTLAPRDEIQLDENIPFKNRKHHSTCFISFLLIYLVTNFALLCFCLHYRIESEEELFELIIDTLFRKNLGNLCKNMNKK